jgi:mono/diheme cytochrome c family protein
LRISNPKSQIQNPKSRLALLALAMLLPLTGGCNLRRILGWDMYNQPKTGKVYKESDFFADKSSARQLVAGTVPRKEVYWDRSSVGVDPEKVNYAGDGYPDFITDDKAPLEGEQLKKVLERGQNVYNIYCAVCHGRTGMADGMIFRRGFGNQEHLPPPFVLPTDQAGLEKMKKEDPHRFERAQLLQNVPPRYFYDVITQGFGAMYSYGERVKVEDRWKVAAYIKALQANPARIEAMPATAPAGEHHGEPGGATPRPE